MKRRLPATTLFVLPAAQSPLALVIRRGPSKCWHFLLWDRDTGMVTPGSWFNGMVYPDRCDLSPKGDCMLLLACRGGGDPPSWTALCSPPAVNANVFWPQKSSRVGGGFFDGRLPVVWINLKPEGIQPELRVDFPYEIGYLEDRNDPHGQLIERLSRDGWKSVKRSNGASEDTVPSFYKRSPSRKFELHFHPVLTQQTQNLHYAECQLETSAYSILDTETDQRVLLEGVNWANWNSRGLLCFSSEGKLLTADPKDVEGTRRVVIDLNDLKPTERTTHVGVGG